MTTASNTDTKPRLFRVLVIIKDALMLFLPPLWAAWILGEVLYITQISNSAFPVSTTVAIALSNLMYSTAISILLKRGKP